MQRRNAHNALAIISLIAVLGIGLSYLCTVFPIFGGQDLILSTDSLITVGIVITASIALAGFCVAFSKYGGRKYVNIAASFGLSAVLAAAYVLALHSGDFWVDKYHSPIFVYIHYAYLLFFAIGMLLSVLLFSIALCRLIYSLAMHLFDNDSKERNLFS